MKREAKRKLQNHSDHTISEQKIHTTFWWLGNTVTTFQIPHLRPPHPRTHTRSKRSAASGTSEIYLREWVGEAKVERVCGGGEDVKGDFWLYPEFYISYLCITGVRKLVFKWLHVSTGLFILSLPVSAASKKRRSEVTATPGRSRKQRRA